MREADLQKIFWHSRRGMLELDLLLVPFAREIYPGLSPSEQLLYRELLEQEDQDLFRWLVHKSPAPDSRFATIIAAILQFGTRRQSP